jgi:hypothetical protein
MTLLEAALAYAARGLPIFPLLPGTKKPATSRGFYDATTNPETIKRFWRIPDRNIGVPTGAPSGLLIIDIDPPRGETEIHRLQVEHGPLPTTRTAISPRGGRHLCFKQPGEPVPSSIGKIAPNIDVKAHGGYVVVAPSVTPDGAYRWSSDPGAPLAIAPDWLIELARAQEAEPYDLRARRRRYQ